MAPRGHEEDSGHGMDVWRAVRENNFAAVEYLLEDGDVPVDERNDVGETPLHIAASRGLDGLVDFLLRHGADPNAQDEESGYSPLHRSFLHDHIDASLLLLNGGAILHTEESAACPLDNDRMSPLDLLSSRLRRSTASSSCVEGEVYTFGKVDFQLGYHLPHGDEQCTPRRVKFEPGVDLSYVSAAMYHTLAVSTAGRCYSWGFGKGGRLGTGSEFNCIHPVQLHFPNHRIIVKASAGENHSLALTSTGQVFSWGSNSFGQLGFPAKQTCAASRLSPKRVDGLKGEVVVDIAAASSHSAVITSNGHVFTWGSNKKGQLGRKEGFGTDQAMHTPKRVDSLLPHHANPAVPTDAASVVATRIAVSCHHTCVVLQVSKDGNHARVHGQVWQWGMGGFFPSQVLLRHQSRDETLRLHHQNVWRPRVQQYPINIVDISCAPQHSIGLSALGNVYVWGHGPHPVAAGGQNYVPLNHRATSIAAAKEHCAVVLASGDVYTWGCGTLGHEGRNWLPNPKRVANIKQAKTVVAGPNHHVVLVTPSRPVLDSTCGHDSLVDRCQHVLRQQVSLQTVVSLYAKADMLDMAALKTMCRQFVAQNLDAVLEMTRNADEWPIELSDEVCQQQLQRQLDTTTSSKKAPFGTVASAEIPIKKEMEKKLRSLQKRVDQLRELELLVSPTDAQKAKIKRKPDLLRQILEIKAQLPRSQRDNVVQRTASPAMRPSAIIQAAAPVNTTPSVVKPNDVKTKPSKPSQAALGRDNVLVATAAEYKPTCAALPLEASKPAAPRSLAGEETKPQRKNRAKFVPLTSFLDAQAAKTPVNPPLSSARSPSPMMLWAAPPPLPPPMKLAPSPSASPKVGPATGGSSSMSAFSLESFMKPSRKTKKGGAVTNNDKRPTNVPWQVDAASATHSLEAIQAAEAIQVKQTWNLKKNQWGLCQNENVNLAAIQSIELEEKQQIEALIAQDCELARKLQAEEYLRAQRRGGGSAQPRSRSKRHGPASVRAA